MRYIVTCLVVNQLENISGYAAIEKKKLALAGNSNSTSVHHPVVCLFVCLFYCTHQPYWSPLGVQLESTLCINCPLALISVRF